MSFGVSRGINVGLEPIQLLFEREQQAERLCAAAAPQAHAGHGVCWPALGVALSEGLVARAGWQVRVRARARRSGQGWAAGVVRAPGFVASPFLICG